MSKFAEAFDEPFYMEDYGYAISAETYPTREEAAVKFTEFMGFPCDPAKVIADAARFQFPTEGIGTPGKPWWETGARGRGSKPVWIWQTG